MLKSIDSLLIPLPRVILILKRFRLNSKENTKLVNYLVEGLITEIREKKIGFFIKTLNNVLKQSDDSEYDTEVWLDVISLMQKEIPQNFFNIKRFNKIWNQSKLLFKEHIQISQAKKFLQNSQFFTLLSNIRNRLSGTFELKEVLDILLKNLPVLCGFPAFFCRKIYGSGKKIGPRHCVK